MLYGDTLECRQYEVALDGISPDAFKLLLSYFYTGNLKLHHKEGELIVELLLLATICGCKKLQTALCSYLEQNLSADIVLAAFKAANLCRLWDLRESCFNFMVVNANEVLENKTLLKLSATELGEMISRNVFYAKEIDIFRAVDRWCAETTDEEEILKLLRNIRFHHIASADLENVVKKSDSMRSARFSGVIKLLIDDPDFATEFSEYRFFVSPELNIATTRCGAAVLTGLSAWGTQDAREEILKPENRRTLTLNSMNGFIQVKIGDKNGITVAFGRPSLINYVMIRLWDGYLDGHVEDDGRNYSYYAEVSLNGEHWSRVVDRTLVECRSVQHLYIKPRVVRYIRFVGTRNSVSRWFHVVTIQAFFTAARKVDGRHPALLARPSGEEVTTKLSVCGGAAS